MFSRMMNEADWVGSCVNVASTFPGLYLVEKLGRRNLLLMGAIGMCVCQFIVAITGTVAGTTDLAAQQAAIAFVCIYIFFCKFMAALENSGELLLITL
jgi:hypothetical protein